VALLYHISCLAKGIYIRYTLNTTKYHMVVGSVGRTHGTRATRSNTPNRGVIFCGIQGITYLSCMHAKN